MLNDSITLSFQFAVVGDTFDIGLNNFPCHGIILGYLMTEDYILNRGGGKHILKYAE